MTATAAPSGDPYEAPGIQLSGAGLMSLRHLARRGVSPSTRTIAGLPGGIVTRKRGRGSEPDDVRPWVEGDDRRFIDRNATAALLYRMAGSPSYTAPRTTSFKDVRPGSAFYKEIHWMSAQGITTGWNDGTFRPLDQTHRDAMAAFLYRFEN